MTPSCCGEKAARQPHTPASCTLHTSGPCHPPTHLAASLGFITAVVANLHPVKPATTSINHTHYHHPNNNHHSIHSPSWMFSRSTLHLACSPYAWCPGVQLLGESANGIRLERAQLIMQSSGKLHMYQPAHPAFTMPLSVVSCVILHNIQRGCQILYMMMQTSTRLVEDDLAI